MHIASMLNKPVIGLFVTSNPFRTGPYYDMRFVINKYPDALIKFNKVTQETVRWGMRIRNKKAMKLITTDDVIETVDKILKL